MTAPHPEDVAIRPMAHGRATADFHAMDYQVVSKNRGNHTAIVDCPTIDWAVTVAELDIERGEFQYIVDIDGARVDLSALKARRQLQSCS
jgi:hypothetical protein